MNLRRALSARLLVTSVLCGLVGLLSSLWVMRWSAQNVILRTFAPLAARAYHSEGKALCEASPSTWRFELEPGVVSFGYDGTTLRSQNPEAPPLDRDLYAAALEAPDQHVATRVVGPYRGGVVVYAVTASSPCGVVQTMWSPRISRPGSILLSAMSLVAAATALIAFWLLVRPVLRRVSRLSRAAERVGDAEGYVPADEGSGDELAQVAQSLDRAHARIRDDAGRLLKRQVDLQRHLADVTHDLRTPIASLQIAIEQAADASGDPAVVELLSGALRDAVYLGGLTENLRLASELREGLSLTEGAATIDLAEIVHRVGERMRFYAARRGIALETATPETPVLVRGHVVAAEQAVRNLVENAIAYGDSGGHIALLLDVPSPEEFVLSVVDDGPGVAPTEIARLGERTFRSDEARQRDPRGSGLGLAITAEVCARSGFSLEFAAEPPRGLRVTLRGEISAER